MTHPIIYQVQSEVTNLPVLYRVPDENAQSHPYDTPIYVKCNSGGYLDLFPSQDIPSISDLKRRAVCRWHLKLWKK